MAKLQTRIEFNFDPPEESELDDLSLNINEKTKEKKELKIVITPKSKKTNGRDNSTGLF